MKKNRVDLFEVVNLLILLLVALVTLKPLS